MKTKSSILFVCFLLILFACTPKYNLTLDDLLPKSMCYRTTGEGFVTDDFGKIHTPEMCTKQDLLHAIKNYLWRNVGSNDEMIFTADEDTSYGLRKIDFWALYLSYIEGCSLKIYPLDTFDRRNKKILLLLKKLDCEK